MYLLFFAIGTIGHHIDSTRTIMLQLTPYVLLLFGLSVLIPLWISRSWGVLLWLAGTFAVTFALEAIGVATGVIFGQYEYGPTLGLKLLQVPLIIGFNWVIVVLGSVRISAWILSKASPGRTSVALVLGPLLVGLLAVLFDLVLEPVAMRFDYWQWTSGIIPMRNYVAWFVIAAVVSLPSFLMKDRAAIGLAAYYVTVQFIFLVSLLAV